MPAITVGLLLPAHLIHSSSTQAALEKLPVIEKLKLILLSIEIPYPFENDIRYFLESFKAVIHNVDYPRIINTRSSLSLTLQLIAKVM